MNDGDARSSGYEPRDARPKAIGLWALALLLLVVGTFFFAGLLERGLIAKAERGELDPHPMAGTRRGPTAALLQTNPPAQMRAFAERERALVETYGWIDREVGVVRLPVERAMELLSRPASQEAER